MSRKFHTLIFPAHLPGVKAHLEGGRRTPSRCNVPNGFTLVELLVVITIMAVLGVFTIANLRTFGEDQDLKNAALDLQSTLRKTQTNSTTSIKCGNDQSYFAWNISFYKDSNGVTKYKSGCELVDQGAKVDEKIYTLPPSVKLARLCADDLTCSSSASCKFEFNTVDNIVVRFKPISGQVSFFGGPVTCFNGVTSMTTVFENTKTNNLKNITIDKGGRVYE